MVVRVGEKKVDWYQREGEEEIIIISSGESINDTPETFFAVNS